MGEFITGIFSQSVTPLLVFLLFPISNEDTRPDGTTTTLASYPLGYHIIFVKRDRP
jgi:hypothetical protein